MAREFVAAGSQERRFEDFEIGDVIVTGGRTVDIADIHAFAGLTGDYYPLHVNEDWAKDTAFGTRIAHGPLTFSIASGLIYLSGYLGTAIYAMLACREMRALKPVFPGDTIHVRGTVVGLDEWKKPHLGVISIEYSVRNQKDEEVMNYTMVMLSKKRESVSGDA